MTQPPEQLVEVPLRTDDDILRARTTVRERTRQLAFSLVKQTKLVTAVSELARNALLYGGGGQLTVATLQRQRLVGVRVVVVDGGPGIDDVDQALRDHFSTGDGMGLGLGGARRLVDHFEIESHPGDGTRVAIISWR